MVFEVPKNKEIGAGRVGVVLYSSTVLDAGGLLVKGFEEGEKIDVLSQKTEFVYLLVTIW